MSKNKTKWTDEKKIKLYNMFLKYGPRWAEFAKEFKMNKERLRSMFNRTDWEKLLESNGLEPVKLIEKAKREESNEKEVKFFTKDEFNNLGSGWHLVGTGAVIDDMSVFGNSKESIWVFENNTWINNTNEIKALQGFWIKK